VRTSWYDEAVVNAKLVETSFATALFGIAAASSLGAAAFGAAAGFLKTGAAFGCAAARRFRAGFAAAFCDALDLLVEGARRDADAAADAVALLLLLLLLDDPAAAVTGAPRFRRCVGLPSSSLLLELPSVRRLKKTAGYRSFFLAALAYCSLVFFVMMSWEHWNPWTRKVLTRTKENPIEVIEKPQLGCGWVAIV
jgi:hypothetical protein